VKKLTTLNDGADEYANVTPVESVSPSADVSNCTAWKPTKSVNVAAAKQISPLTIMAA
jgi:hypothetical protein